MNRTFIGRVAIAIKLKRTGGADSVPTAPRTIVLPDPSMTLAVAKLSNNWLLDNTAAGRGSAAGTPLPVYRGFVRASGTTQLNSTVAFTLDEPAGMRREFHSVTTDANGSWSADLMLPLSTPDAGPACRVLVQSKSNTGQSVSVPQFIHVQPTKPGSLSGRDVEITELKEGVAANGSGGSAVKGGAMPTNRRSK